MVAKKRASKRQTLQQKYKIKKRTKEHHKRLKKGAIISSGTRKKQADHIPNAWPYKEELLREIQEAKDRMEEVKQNQKLKRKEELEKRRAANTMSVDSAEDTKPKNVLNFGASETFEEQAPEDDVEGSFEMKNVGLGQNSRRAFMRELRKVVESADVILHVLDARDPQGTKSLAIENMVLAKPNKKLVYILNKADLVPRDVLADWLRYLRRYQPTVPFKCNTQSQRGNLGTVTGKVAKQQESALKTTQAVGTEELLGLLKNYSRAGDVKTIISVGIVGFPNVGKSSLINSLLRTRTVGVSAMPGFTRVSQEVILDKNIRLIDSPGIVFADGDNAATSLRNCVNVEELDDVTTPLQAILDRCPVAYLMQLYNIPKFKSEDCMSFLALVARATGKLKKGGIPNTDAAARSVLHDWNEGKIKYYCKAPQLSTGGGVGESETVVLSGFSKGIDLSDLKDEDIRVLNELEAIGSESGVAMESDELVSDVNKDQTTLMTIGESAPTEMSKKMKVRATTAGSDSSTSSRQTQRKQQQPLQPDEIQAAGIRSVGVLSRQDDDGALDAVDLRKLQKQSKKKAKKELRREQNTEMVEDAPYSFETDFQY